MSSVLQKSVSSKNIWSSSSKLGLKKENEFEMKLRALLAEYGYSLKDMINLLAPQAGRRTPCVESKTDSCKLHQVKVYKNPHTGEVVETKGGNFKTLRE
ncbi:H-NS histone family [Pseudomonas sp. G5(2012)]|nr:H-NS histone family [Pseudomonas sp. G5(2012)]